MNRIFAAVAPAPVAITRVDPPVVKAAPRGSHHTLLAPLHYEPNYAYPLVVWLHGDGGDERQLMRVMPHISMRNYVAVGVRGPSAAALRPSGYGWEQSEDAICQAQQSVQEAVAAARIKFHVHCERVFLAGFECGGTMALRLALRNPWKYAGALSACGGFPRGQMPLVNLKSLREFPLLMAFGRDSAVYAADDVCRELPLMHSAGLKVALRQYPCEDELTTQMLHDMDVWLMERVTGLPSECEEAAVGNLSELN